MACDVARLSDDTESRRIAENRKYIFKELKTRVRDKQSIRHLQDVVNKVQTENTVLKGQLEEERLKNEFMEKQHTEQAENLKLLSSREQALSEKLVSCRIEMGTSLQETEQLKRQLQGSKGRPLSIVKNGGHHDELTTCLAEAKQETGSGIINPHKITDRQNLWNGRFGHTFRALYEHKPVVVDQLVSTADLNAHHVQEKQLLQRWNTSRGLTSIFIMEVFGFCLDSERGIYWLIMEFMARGCLSGLLEDKTLNLTWEVKIQLALDVGRGIDFLHSQEDPMLLRNICCANILVSEDFRAKICDVGDVEIHDRADRKKPISPEPYQPPECLSDEECDSPYPFEAEYYGYGKIMESIAKGMDVVNDWNVKAKSAIISGEKMALPEDCPATYKHVTQGLTQFEPSERMKVRDAVETLLG